MIVPGGWQCPPTSPVILTHMLLVTAMVQVSIKTKPQSDTSGHSIKTTSTDHLQSTHTQLRLTNLAGALSGTEAKTCPTWASDWTRNMPREQPLTVCVPVLSQTNFWSGTPRMSEAKFGNSAQWVWKVQHKVYMVSMWFSFQQFGLRMPFSNSVKCSNIKTCLCRQNIPLKAPEDDIMWHEVRKFLHVAKTFQHFAVNGKGGRE